MADRLGDEGLTIGVDADPAMVAEARRRNLADPGVAFAQLRRVLRPGGLLGVAEPDWDTLVIDDVDVEASRAYTRLVATQVVRNAAIGRALPRLAAQADLDEQAVTANTVLYTDFQESADPQTR